MLQCTQKILKSLFYMMLFPADVLVTGALLPTVYRGLEDIQSLEDKSHILDFECIYSSLLHIHYFRKTWTV